MTDKDLPNFINERQRDATVLTWFRFIRVLRKFIPQINEYLSQWNLSQGQFDLLAVIAKEEGVNQQACADQLNVTKGNVGQHLNNLEKRGFMRREKRGRDNHIFLTQEGRELFLTIMPIHDEYVKATLAVLTKEEMRQFAAILRKLDRSRD